MKDTPQIPVRLADYTPSPFQIDDVFLSFSIEPDYVRVRSRLRIHAENDRVEDLVLQGQDLQLVSISLDGEPLAEDRYCVDESSLTLFLAPHHFVLEMDTEIDPAENTALEGLYLSNGIYCTQCESEGFRRITYFLDRPDIMTVYTTEIEGDATTLPVLLSNGNLIEAGQRADGRHFARWQDPFKKPSYLFALVAGDLDFIEDTFTTKSGRRVLLRIYVEPHNIRRCDHAMASLKHAMAWDEEMYGREYDLDLFMIVAVDDFNAGAMENKGLNIFNSKYILADPATATDDDFEAIEAVVAHEYFHNWTGNRITCRDWFQLSLKEGLTVFRDQEFSSDQTSRAVKRISDVRLLRNHQFPEDAGPMAHPVRPDSYVEINNFYTLTVYEKGAELIRMYHTILGAEHFRRAMDIYFERHDGHAVTTEDFARCMAETYKESGRQETIDFDQFRLWYSQAGTPGLAISTHYDPETRQYALTVHQKRPEGVDGDHKMMLIPLLVGLLDGQGQEMPLTLVGSEAPQPKQILLPVCRERETFVFENIVEKPVPSLLRTFSAPIKLSYDYTDEELLFLLAHDTDPFNRWEAGQRYAVKQLLELIRLHAEKRPLVLEHGLSHVFGKLIAGWDSGEDLSFLCQLVTLPSEEFLVEQMEIVDVEGIHVAREFLRAALAEEHADALFSQYDALNDADPYRYDTRLSGRRRLKNLCLSYLGTLQHPEAIQRAVEQQARADNMTDEIAALKVLVHGNSEERHDALQSFYGKWQENALVLDKWFALQATAPRTETLEEVQGLMEHPKFSIKNPNRVRALIGTFAGANPVCFHAADGSGYRFLADCILRIDPLNSHVSSRLLTRLGRWKRYDSGRQQLMYGELERVARVEKLSKGAREVVDRCLKG